MWAMTHKLEGGASQQQGDDWVPSSLKRRALSLMVVRSQYLWFLQEITWGTRRTNYKAQVVSVGVGGGMGIGRRASQQALDSWMPYHGGGLQIRGWKPRAAAYNKL